MHLQDQCPFCVRAWALAQSWAVYTCTSKASRTSIALLVLAHRGGPQSSLMFCTNGVLLRMLTQGEGLQVSPYCSLSPSNASRAQGAGSVSMLATARRPAAVAGWELHRITQEDTEKGNFRKRAPLVAPLQG